MSKIILNNVESLLDATTAAVTINTNSAVIQTAMDNTLSRDGTTPNQMLSVLDMNSNEIVNLPPPTSPNAPIRFQDLTTLQAGGTVVTLPVGGTTGQSLQKNSNTNYDVKWGSNVSSVGLALPADFTVTGSPVTGAGTLTGTFVNTPTGSGGFVRATSPTIASPTLTTPNIGAATATSVNNVILTQPASSATLTVANGKILTASNTLTLAGTDSTTLTFQGTDTYVGRATTDTLTNKTYDTAGTGNSFRINGNAITSNTGTGAVNVLSVSPAITGTSTNDSAASGVIGELISATLVQGSAVALTNSVPANVTSINLTAGDWDVTAIVYYTGGATTTVNFVQSSVGTTSATLDTTPGRLAVFSGGGNPIFVSSQTPSNPIIPARFSLSGTTQIFLVALAAFGTSTCSAFGFIRGRRIR